MKLYLASFLQPKNFGPGRVIGITTGSKPRDINVNIQFMPVTPPATLIASYNAARTVNAQEAGEIFVSTYKSQLEGFVREVKQASAEENLPVEEVLPFQDGDTLCSWERAEYTNYRKILAPYLEELGYEVVLN